MADDLNKDVVAARINLDTAKILPAFKVIDDGARKNAETFKGLNAELAVTAKSYGEMAKAADKLALTADQRRNKILEESKALVASRNAQAEYYKAKSQQLDLNNQVVDSKLKSQQLIQKKREDAIEQQEKEHQQRMATLTQNTMAAGSRENLMQAKLDREFQMMKINDARIEMEAERHYARMNRMSQSILIADDFGIDARSSLTDKIKNAAIHATVFHGVYTSIHEVQHALKVGLVDIEANMAGYVQTNEKYFVSFNEGTHEMVMNTERLHDETVKFIQTAHDLGSEITDVTESARLWGRMYKDVGIVQEMVRASTKLHTVDLVELEEATKGMESVMSQYSVHIRDANDAMVIGNRVLDSWSKVAHDTMAPAKDLAAAFERTGKIADETGVSFDFMNGLVSAGVRNTALGGANLGNMWKTVLGTIRTDKAVNEIENLGVATKEVVNGTEQWRRAEDILLDLSIKVIDKNYDLTQSYADISRGVYQYAKLAASLNVGDILVGTASSIGSSGSTMEYLKVQMDTIQRKAAQTKASLLEIFNQAGDDGLRSAIKNALDVLDQLLIGIAKVPKEFYQVGASVAALVVVYKTIVQPLMLWKTAQEALTVAMRLNTVTTNAQTIAMIAQTAAARNAAMMTALATGGITLLTGVIATSIFMLGSAEKKERDLEQARKDNISVNQQLISQYQRQEEFLPKLVDAHNQLQKQYDNLTEAAKTDTNAAEKQIDIKGQLDKVSQALTITLGREGAAQLEAAGYTVEAVNKQLDVLRKLKSEKNDLVLGDLKTSESGYKSDLDSKDKRIKEIEEQTKMLNDSLGSVQAQFQGSIYGEINVLKKEKDKLLKEKEDVEKSLIDTRIQITEMGVESAYDALAGQKSKQDKVDEAYDAIKQTMQSDVNQFRHLVNIQEKGYQTAGDQLQKLQAIRNKYAGKLNAEDLWGLDEEIYRTGEGKKVKPKGMGSGSPKTEDQLQKSFDAFRKRLEHEKSMGELTVKEELELWKKAQAAFASRTEFKWQADEKVYALEKKLVEDKQKKEQESFNQSEKWISHKKSMGELSLQQELAAWERVQARYRIGTEERMKADEQVYSLKKSLIQDEEKSLDKIFKKETDYLKDSKQAALQKIEDDRDAYISATDDKIQEIDRLIAAEQDANDDGDYEKKLAEKQARLALLASAVGPEGIKERRDVAKEIEDMQLEHQRVLRKRDLEGQKQTLEDEKRTKEAAWDQDKKDIEKRYDDLLKAFDDFTNDTAGRAEFLKNIQIMKESEKNATILSNLDAFISEYQTKMSKISNLSMTQEQKDLQEYNSNKDQWDAAKAKGDTETMSKLGARNKEIRDQYGIKKDTGKLQHFADGGLVQGRQGEAVPVVAHAGEMYLNPNQQGNLFRLLDFKMPALNFTAPSFAMASGQNQSVVNHNYYKVSTGDVMLGDDADIRTFWTERDNMVRRFQSRGGAKQR